MTSLTLTMPTAHADVPVTRRLWQLAGALLAAAVLTSLAALVDDRSLGHAGVWMKPLKFQLALALQSATLAWGKERAANWLSILDKHYIGPDNAYLCGNDITIADYFGIGIVTLGEVIKCDFTPYPNVQRWMANMKKLPNWDKVNEVFNGFASSVKDVPFEAL